MKNLFPLKVSKHKMIKRKQQKFQVKLRQIEKKSHQLSIMQYLLNYDEEKKINDTKIVLNFVNGEKYLQPTFGESGRSAHQYPF